MALGCSVDSALVKSVSPITLAPLVCPVMTKLSDEIDRKLDRICRVRLARPVPLPRFVVVAGPVHQAGLLQHAQHLLHIDQASPLVGGERQFERGALHVVHEDVQVVGIDEAHARARRRRNTRDAAPRTGRSASAGRHHDRRRLPRPPAGAAGALPGRGNGARIAGHHAHVERADVDAESPARWSRRRRGPPRPAGPFRFSRRRSGR